MWETPFIALFVLVSLNLYRFYRRYILRPSVWSANLQEHFKDTPLIEAQQRLLTISMVLHMLVLIFVGLVIMVSI